MHDVDLIPSDYSAWLWRRKLLIKGGIVLLLLVAMLVSVSLFLSDLSAQNEKRIAAMQVQIDDNQYQLNQLEELFKVRKKLQREIRFLEGIRSGIEVPRLLSAIDQALGDKPIWFKEWNYLRANSLIKQSPATVTQGYFIVLSQGNTSSEPMDNVLKLDTHMTIQGQSSDHLALSTFLRSLSQFPQFNEVNLIRTSLRRYTNSSALDFDLKIAIIPEDH